MQIGQNKIEKVNHFGEIGFEINTVDSVRLYAEQITERNKL